MLSPLHCYSFIVIFTLLLLDVIGRSSPRATSPLLRGLLLFSSFFSSFLGDISLSSLGYNLAIYGHMDIWSYLGIYLGNIWLGHTRMIYIFMYNLSYNCVDQYWTKSHIRITCCCCCCFGSSQKKGHVHYRWRKKKCKITMENDKSTMFIRDEENCNDKS